MKALGKLIIEREFDPYDESVSTREWMDERNRQVAKRGESPPSSSCLLWLESSLEFEIELRKGWKEKLEGPAMDTMMALINMGNTAEEIQTVRKEINPSYDIATESDDELLVLRDELRTFWNEVAKETRGSNRRFGDNVKVATMLHKWWDRYKIEPNSGGWKFWPEVGQFYPTPKNFRATVARGLVEKRRRLSQCPRCSEYFIKTRADQKNCLSVTCQRQANNERQKQFQQKKNARKSRKARS